ncbi:MAG TPA: Gfo/Idh/MocA family oxidoreductase [Microvirga sp.]|jgi:predicted dehydrogenase|nr:Gfo/Idh/MocA family oxidoreductase [Microvirga sp.]
MSATRLGVIGYGIMGERLLRAAAAHRSVAVAGVWDPSSEAMGRLKADLPDVPRLADADAVIAASDCLYVASPPASHVAYAGAALERGRAVFCEKPLAVDLAAARGLVEAFEARGGRGAVNFPFASSPAVEQLAAWLRDGAVGAVREVTVEIAFAAWPRPWQADAAGWLDRREQGGFTREVVSHFLFLCLRLLGPLRLDAGRASFPEAGRSERAIAARLDAGGIPVTLAGRVGGTDKADHNLWTAQGERGALRLRDWSIAEKRDGDGPFAEAPGAIRNEEARPLVLARQLDKVAALTRGEKQNLATLRDALEVQEIVEAILRS